MNRLTTSQIKCCKALINKLHLQAQKDNLVLGFSNQRTSHVTELTSSECNAFIAWLKSQDTDEQKAEKMRRKIIAIARSMGWQKNEVQPNGSIVQKADMQRIDEFCKSKGYLHKKLNQYLYNQLPTLVSQFEAVQKSYLNKF
jgi:hypothetical protein